MSHAEQALAEVWTYAQKGRDYSEFVLEAALAAALEDGEVWPRLVAHFGWALPTQVVKVGRQDKIETGRTDLRLHFAEGRQVVLELKAWGPPTPEQLTRYADKPEIRVIGVARYPAVRSGPQVVGCITWSSLVALPWPDSPQGPPLPWRQLRALARTMGVAVPPVDLLALTGLIASYDAQNVCKHWARAAAERLHHHLQWEGGPWRFKSPSNGKRSVERKWRRHVGWCWVAPYSTQSAAGAFAGLSFGRSDVPLIIPGLPDLILSLHGRPGGPLSVCAAKDAALEAAVKRWQAAPHHGVREFNPGSWEFLRARAPGTRILEAPDTDQALLDWLDEELQAWHDAGILAAVRALIESTHATGGAAAETDEMPGDDDEADEADTPQT